MDGNPTGPVASPPCSVARPAPHQILVSWACRHTGQPCKPGLAFLAPLRAAIATAGLGEDFEMSGTACLSECMLARSRPCVVGWRASARATWLFGDIDPGQPLDDLVAFARACANLEGDRTAGASLPSDLCDDSLARIPAALIVTREGAIQ